MGAIFAVMNLNSSLCGVHYREKACAHPHCSLAKRDLMGPEGRVRLVGGVEGTYRTEGGCGDREGYPWDARRKETINTQLMTSNTPTTQQ